MLDRQEVRGVHFEVVYQWYGVSLNQGLMKFYKTQDHTLNDPHTFVSKGNISDVTQRINASLKKTLMNWRTTVLYCALTPSELGVFFVY